MTESSSDRKILVIGSVVWGVVLTPETQPPNPLTFSPHATWVGWPTVRDMIETALCEVA